MAAMQNVATQTDLNVLPPLYSAKGAGLPAYNPSVNDGKGRVVRVIDSNDCAFLAKTKLAESQANYQRRKEDAALAKALAEKSVEPKSTLNLMKEKASNVLKTLADWVITVAKTVYRYTGLQYVVNTVTNYLAPKLDLYTAKKVTQEPTHKAMLGELKAVQLVRGVANTGAMNHEDVVLPGNQRSYIDLAAQGFKRGNYPDMELVAHRSKRDLALSQLEDRLSRESAQHRADLLANPTEDEVVAAASNAQTRKETLARLAPAQYVQQLQAQTVSDAENTELSQFRVSPGGVAFDIPVEGNTAQNSTATVKASDDAVSSAVYELVENIIQQAVAETDGAVNAQESMLPTYLRTNSTSSSSTDSDASDTDSDAGDIDSTSSVETVVYRSRFMVEQTED